MMRVFRSGDYSLRVRTDGGVQEVTMRF
jgi:inorganic triphosphatase YgiF